MNNLLVTSQNKDLVSNDRKGQREKIHDLNHVSELSAFVDQSNSHNMGILFSKLELITKQIKFLQSEANNLIEEANHNFNLTNARCNFKRVVGNIYHLYKSDKEYYFSMLSPKDYNYKNRDEFIDSYLLKEDMTWINYEHIKEYKERKIDFNILGVNTKEVKYLENK